MECLIRFRQMHETFRRPESEALADLHGFAIEWLSYSDDSPFALVRFSDTIDPLSAARALASRSILIWSVHELWGEGTDYATLHSNITRRTSQLWSAYREPSFRFVFDSHQHSRSTSDQRAIFEELAYLDLQGPIVMKNPDHLFTIFEDYEVHKNTPKALFFGRLLAESSAGAKAVVQYNLKKRKYIATTSMDAELSLITANIALCRPGCLAYDPFMGTGSFPLAAAHFGSTVFGSDLDGRSIRGKKGRNVAANFTQYGTSARYLDGFAADLTNTPLRKARCLDAILCDPPYGVREGLKVLGSTRDHLQQEIVLRDGTLAHLKDDYIPPRKAYSFPRMLDDILTFSVDMLVSGGRLSMWMPVAGAVEEEQGRSNDGQDREEKVEEYALPRHPALVLVSQCRQDFNKWSRRLLTYRRLDDSEVDAQALAAYEMQKLQLQSDDDSGGTADDLNEFRKKYFQGFK
ncbi:Putative RNA methylase domain, DNA methylase, N-6 adenine-specific [Septoria linicola]|uniref:tRNA (guanine(10)-N(2))-methyltransferase n=1 Tax=Septoria linicola TaxID=215465 RepID=A0A9Q9AEN3_9PEZI|nr:putative RNA methylase domain, DNA methylase, N-6 adenine-specific [Septoria linicola]USW47720.1 Putative RNA methylase domain, DNA methylase, N-6 adenine-specific [Septoria linicola]